MTCRKPAPVATAALLAGAALLLGAAPARAGLFGPAKPAAPKPAAAAASPPKADPARRAAAERLDPLARAAFWAREHDVDPADVEAGVRLAAAVRTLGRYDEAAETADGVLVLHPTDEEALLEAARARIAGTKSFYAIELLQRAVAGAPGDWRPQSLLGVAYDETKRPAEAQAAWSQALRLSPENPGVLANMGMSAAAHGRRGEAEALLRRAAAAPGAGVRERQDLAYVLGLDGRFAEAESLIRRDLPPEEADSNLALLKATYAAR